MDMETAEFLHELMTLAEPPTDTEKSALLSYIRREAKARLVADGLLEIE